MAQTLKFKRGLNGNFGSQTLEAGEPAFILDTGKLYIGDGTNKVLINPDPSSNAATATKLQTARTISLTGDVTGTVSFDGSANVSISTAYKNSGVTAGTYTKTTVDAKGNITAGTTLSESDIPSLTLSKISDAGTAASKNTGTSSGNIPVLDSSGKLNASVFPAITISDTFVVAAQTAMLALTAEVGDVAVRTDLSKSFILKTAGASTLANWQELLTPTDSVTSVAGKNGDVTLTSSDVGLGNVNNTSDSSKNVLSATKWTTARTLSLTGDVTGSTSIDGSGNASITATVADDSHNHIISNIDNLQTTLNNKTPFSTLSATTATTSGWYRVASSAVNIGANSGLFKIDFSGTGVMGSVLFRASCHNGAPSGSAINQLGFSTTAGSLGLTQIRVVYHTTSTSNYAYVEVYNPTALAITYTIDLIDSTGWSLITPSTSGSIPSGYTSESLTLNTGIVSIEDVEAARQLISKIATGTAPLIVTSTTKVSNLNVDKLDDMDASSTNTASTIVSRDGNGNFSAGIITASLSGNSTSATTLQTARTISISGGATGTATSFNGSANISIPITSINTTYLSGTIDGGTF